MSKTIRQLAMDLHITKQAIYQRMDAIDNFRDDYTTRIANRIMVDSKGEQLLRNFDNVDKYSQQDDTTQQQANNASSSDAMVLLMDQLKVKDKQLDAKDEQLKRLQKSLDQQQQLQLATINENNNLKQQLKQLDGFDTSDTPTSEPAQSANTTNAKHKKWWQFWD